MIEYPLFSSAAFRFGGIGDEKNPWAKRICKAISFLLFSVPLIVYYHRGDWLMTSLFGVSIFAAMAFRRQIASSRDFPHRGETQLLGEKPFINFDGLIDKLYMNKELANQQEKSRRYYKAISYSLNKVVIGLPVYIVLAVFLNPLAILGAFSGLLFGPVYYLCYDVGDRLKKDGHMLAEFAIGFLLGLVELLIFILFWKRG